MQQSHAKTCAAAVERLEAADFEGALEQARLAIAEAPDETMPYNLAVAALVALGRTPEGLGLIQAAQDRYPDMPLYRDRDFRLQQRRAIERGLPPILINTQFKSASMYIASKLAAGLDLPRCYISCTPIEDRIVPSWARLLGRGGAIAQEHLLPDRAMLAFLPTVGIDRLVLNLRDPRQSMLSAIHHYAGKFRAASADGVIVRARFPAGYDGWSLERRIDHFLDAHFPALVAWIDGWLALSRAPLPGLAVLPTSYAEFQADRPAYFARALDFLGIAREHFDWAVLEGEAATGELHFRKGDPTEWQSVLTPEQQARAQAIMTDAVHRWLASPGPFRAAS